MHQLTCLRLHVHVAINDGNDTFQLKSLQSAFYSLCLHFSHFTPSPQSAVCILHVPVKCTIALSNGNYKQSVENADCRPGTKCKL